MAGTKLQPELVDRLLDKLGSDDQFRSAFSRDPKSALQSIGGQRVVFVRRPDGFEKRPVAIGHTDEQIAEVTSGLQPAEAVAATNTFLLKSELLKGGVED